MFIVYLTAVILIGFISGRKGKRSTADFFLAGRGLPCYVIGFSLIASSISSEQFIGEVGWGYKYGMAVANWEWLVWPAQG
ncbi:sodium/glucose cotransporter, partial [candidate division KSB1 bacterium]